MTDWIPLKAACIDAGQYGLNVAAEEYTVDGFRLLRTTDLSGAREDVEPVFVSGPLEQRHRLKPGDLLLSRSGTIGMGFLVGADACSSTFAGYLVRFRPHDQTDPRYLHYATQAEPFQATVRSEAVSSTITNFNAERYANVRIPRSDYHTQRRIADFLDDQVGRMDAAVGHVRQLGAQADERVLARLSQDLLDPDGLGALPWRSDVPTAPVGALYSLELGKMLNEERAAGARRRPYLRNTNVQWDRIDVDDLKEMEFLAGERRRYEVLEGDLLICEGGQPGRCAVWDGRVPEIYFQKALHRARPRGANLARWLFYCLRLAVSRSAFNDAGGTTIAHLTGEQLREFRIPRPALCHQDRLIVEWDAEQQLGRVVAKTCQAQAELLEERRRALITACVTGEFDVSAAGNRAGDAALQGVTR